MRALIDNSTYYSSKIAIEEGVLTAQTVYNLATFLECLVVADKVGFAPTTLWYPGIADGYLFEADGPCVRLPSVAESDEEARRVFVRAIDESLSDLDGPVVRRQFASSVAEEARRLLSGYRTKAQEDPAGFMETYSGIVYLTDEGASAYFEETFGKEGRALPAGQHLTNYLLRSNVAMEISDRLIYHPHSQRVPLVCNKMGVQAKQSPSLASDLIRYVEKEMKQTLMHNARESLLMQFKPFACMDHDMPLVLAVVLSGASTPGDIIPGALKLRNLPEAKKYREWAGEVATAIRGQDIATRNEACRQMAEAREILSKELARLYGARQGSAPSRWSQIASVADPEEIAGANTRSVLLKLGKEVLRRAPGALDAWRAHRVRKRLALLINLPKREKPDDLNSLLGQVFGKKLTGDQLNQFDLLRENQATLMSELVRDVQQQ